MRVGNSQYFILTPPLWFLLVLMHYENHPHFVDQWFSNFTTYKNLEVLVKCASSWTIIPGAHIINPQALSLNSILDLAVFLEIT